MSRHWKMLLTLALCAALALSLFGCGGSAPSGTDDGEAPPAASNGADPSEAPSDDPIVHQWYGQAADGEYLLFVQTDNTFEMFFNEAGSPKDSIPSVRGTWEANGDGTYFFTADDGSLPELMRISEGGTLDTAYASLDPVEDGHKILQGFFEASTAAQPEYDVAAEMLNAALDDDRIDVQVSAVVTNTGSAPIELTDISFDVEDEDGTFLESVETYQTECIPAVIPPGGNGYLTGIAFVKNNVTQEYADTFARTVVHFTCSEAEGASVTEYEVESPSLYPDGRWWAFKGRVINHTDQTASGVCAVALAYGADDTLLAVMSTNPLAEIEPNGKLGFDDIETPVSTKALAKDQVARVEAFAFSVEK